MKVIDIHAHYVAPSLLELIHLETGSSSLPGGAAPPHNVYAVRLGDGRWQVYVGARPTPPLPPAMTDLEQRIHAMREQGIEMQILSTQIDLSGYHLSPEDGLWFARAQNDALAQEVRRQPEYFAAMATVPLQAPELAAQELRRAIVDLGLCGVEIGTSINGRPLDEPSLDVFWGAAQELDIPIFMHPLAVPELERLRDYFLYNLIGYPAETCVAAARLIFGGVLDRFPTLKICLAHGGGVLPALIGRLARGYEARPEFRAVLLKLQPRDYLQRFKYDTITHAQEGLATLLDLVGPERLLLGSDYPFEMGDPRAVERVGALAGDNQKMRAQIVGGNAVALFRLAVS